MEVEREAVELEREVGTWSANLTNGVYFPVQPIYRERENIPYLWDWRGIGRGDTFVPR
jgi:hypothetical protein